MKSKALVQALPLAERSGWFWELGENEVGQRRNTSDTATVGIYSIWPGEAVGRQSKGMNIFTMSWAHQSWDHQTTSHHEAFRDLSFDRGKNCWDLTCRTALWHFESTWGLEIIEQSKMTWTYMDHHGPSWTTYPCVFQRFSGFPADFVIYTVSSVEVVGDWGWPFMSMAKRWHRSSGTPFSKALLQVVNLLLAKSGQLGPQNLHELPGKSLVDWFCRFNGLPSKYLNTLWWTNIAMENHRS